MDVIKNARVDFVIVRYRKMFRPHVCDFKNFMDGGTVPRLYCKGPKNAISLAHAIKHTF